MRFNWAGNYGYGAPRLAVPADAAEIAQLVRGARRAKALGSRHCFNDIADSAELQISVEKLDRVVEASAAGATVEAGLRYGDICPELDRRGLALHNLASLPHISVAGACMTATHGSGAGNRNLAAAVSAIEFVDGRAEIVTLRRGDEDFAGAVVSLGALGIVTKLTLDVEPTYDVRQDCFLDLSLADAALNFESIMAAGYSVSLFTGWSVPRIDQVWIKSRADRVFAEPGGEFYGAKAAATEIHPIAGVSPENCTPQLGLAGVWYERLPHFRMGFTPSVGAELQSEYFVAREHAVEALGELAKLRERIAPLLLVSEIRAVAADEMWLSMNHERDSVAFHFTWKPDQDAVMRLLPVIEKALARLDVRPHWGKLFATSAGRLRELYPKFDDFVRLMKKYDPEGKFRNAFLDRIGV